MLILKRNLLLILLAITLSGVSSHTWADSKLDIDGNNNVDALTDGILIIRYMFGLRGESLITDALGNNASRDAADIEFFIQSFFDQYDVDGNSSQDALTDGLLIVRHLFGLTGSSLFDSSVGANATTPDEILGNLVLLANGNTKIRLDVMLFGRGKVISQNSLISIDSDQPENNINFVIIDSNPQLNITLTATPTADTEVLGWSGCDVVSLDRLHCTVSQERNRQIIANFGFIDTVMSAEVYDLSAASVVVTEDTVDAVISQNNNNLVNQLTSLVVNDFIVGDEEGGFLRKVTSFQIIDDHHYIFSTVNATLEEVILQGSGQIQRQLTNGDLQGFNSSSIAARNNGVPPHININALPGVTLLVSEKADDPVFKIKLGGLSSRSGALQQGAGVTDKVTLFQSPDGVKVEAEGSIDLKIKLDTGASFGGSIFTGNKHLDAMKFIIITEATENLKFSVSGELAGFGNEPNLLRKRIATLVFARVVFWIGPVPVYNSITAVIYLGAQGSVEAAVSTKLSLQQTLRGGFNYTRDHGFDGVAEFRHSENFNPLSQIGFDLTGKVKGYLDVEPKLLIYGATGPALPTRNFIEAKGQVQASNFSCVKFDAGITAGIQANFKWDLSGGSKFGQLLHLDQLENQLTFNIFGGNFFSRTWNTDDGCDLPVLNVSGNAIEQLINGSSATETIFNISNTGKGILEWEVDFNNDGKINVFPVNGILPENSSELVLVNISDINTPGIYGNILSFKNKSDTKAEIVTRDVKIIKADFSDSAPVITSISQGSNDNIVLNWIYDDELVGIPMSGYTIFSTLTPNDPNSWSVIENLPNTKQQSIDFERNKFPASGTVYLKMLAYSEETDLSFETQDSNIKSIQLEDNNNQGKVRIILSWGANPRDLDTHLFKFNNSGNEDYHIYYGNRTASNGDNLDIDDVDSFGPETVTIQNIDLNSRYVFSIHHFSGSGSITSTSQAKVKIIFENGTSRTFFAPTSGDGIYWKVFEITGGELIPCSSGCISSFQPRSLSGNLNWKTLLQRDLVDKNLAPKLSE